MNCYRAAGVMLAACITIFAATAAGQENREDEGFILRRARAFHEPRRQTSTPVGAANARLEALNHAESMPALPQSAGYGGDWDLIGPRPTIVLTDAKSAGWPIASGRVTSIAVHPVRSEIAYLGAAHGGVWKTADAGQNWVPLTDDQVSLAIGSLAIDPSNPDVVYAGTGEENFSADSYFGAGILKTEDAGETWKLVGTDLSGPSSATFAGARIGALAVHPEDSRILLAGIGREAKQSSGVYRSTDAGVSWQAVLTGAPGTSVVFNPADPSIVYAGLGGRDESRANGIYKSTDGGSTWTLSSGGIPAGAGRVSLTIAASSPNVLYSAIASPTSAEPLGVFKTIDGGETWSSANTPSYCYGTCWYANSIQVAPNDPDVVLVGGLILYMTRDGGESWVSVSQGAYGNFIHWDIHVLVFGSGGHRLYVGTDGGIYRADSIDAPHSKDIGWNNINDTLATTQFYPGCSAHGESADPIVCGTQDNGTQIYTGNDMWRMIGGGDGGFTALDTARPSVFYLSAAGNVSIQKSSPFTLYNGFIDITAGLESVDATDCFLPPLTLDPAHPERLYFGCRRIYRSSDAGGSWDEASDVLPDLDDGDPAAFTSIAVAPSRSERVYAAANDGKVYVTSNATASTGVKWTAESQGLPGRHLSSVAVDSGDSDTAYASVLGFSGFGDSLGHVFKTTNGGRNWMDISGNLPNLPVNTIVADEDSPGSLFIGSDIGVFRTVDGGDSWSPVGKGLPRCPVVDIKLHSRYQLLRVATHGRGMWELPRGPMAKLTPSFRVQSAEPSSGTPSKLIVTGTGFTNEAIVRWNGEERPTSFVNLHTLEAELLPGELPSPERSTVSVRLPTAGRVSNSINVETGGPPVIERIANGAGAGRNSGNATETISLAPGTLASIYGQNLSAHTVTQTSTSPGQTLGGAIVEFKSYVTHRSYPAGLLYVSPTQINFQVPWEVPQGATLDVDVVQGSRMSEPVKINIGRFSPGLFSLNASGYGQGSVFCVSDGRIAGPAATNSRPAKRGELLRILATGLGPYWHESGSMPPSTIAKPQVEIGGVAATVDESIAQLPFIGIYEVTVQLPARSPSGPTVLVNLTAGGNPSNGVTIAVE